MKRSLTVLLLLGGVARAAPGEVMPLRDLRAVVVNGGVEATSDVGLNSSEIRSRTEAAARCVGLEVVGLGKVDLTVPMLRATFRVLEVEHGTYAYVLDLGLQEPCRISRNGLTTFCTTWKRQVLGSAAGPSGMMAALDGALQAFEDDFHAARQ